MKSQRTRTVIALICAAWAAACASGGAEGPVTAGVRRAALARLTIENRTAQRLTIGYRLAGVPGGEVVVGGVAARSTVVVAPIVAGEPVELIARDEQGGEYRLPPRSFGVDAGWIWVIPADARFEPAAEARP